MKFELGKFYDDEGEKVLCVAISEKSICFTRKNAHMFLRLANETLPEWKEPKRKVKFLGWTTMDSLYLMVEGTIVPPNWKRVPSADCEHEVDE